MTTDDFDRLRLYRDKFGPMNPMVRLDAAVARLSVLQCQVAGVKHQSGRPMEGSDFMPYPRVEEAEATPEELAAILGGKKSG